MATSKHKNGKNKEKDETPDEVVEQLEGKAHDAFQEAEAEGEVAVSRLSEAAATMKEGAQEAAHAFKGEVETLAKDLQASAQAAAAQVATAATDEVKAKGEQVTDEAALRAHLAKDTVADKIHETAERVRQRSTLPEAKVINKVADKIDDTANYVRSHDYGEMRGDFELQVKESPLLAVVLALMVGFLLGALIKRG